MATSRIPLVVILGATGAGKSKLAIEIAKIFRGEIISADSMQIYKGLDIITNKVSEEEQQECPHHLLSYLEADHKHYTIVDFRDAALPLIDELLAKQILPIVVGGTNYYIESVLWNFLIDSKTSIKPCRTDAINFNIANKYNIKPSTADNLLIDPKKRKQQKHSFSDGSLKRFESQISKKQKLSSQKLSSVDCVSEGVYCSNRPLNNSLQKSRTKPSPVASRLTAFLESALPARHGGLDVNSGFQLSNCQSSLLISDPGFGSSHSSPDHQLASLTKREFGSQIPQTSDTSDSIKSPLEVAPTFQALHTSNPHKKVDTRSSSTTVSLNKTSNTNSNAYHETVGTATSCAKSSSEEGSLVEASLVNIGDSDFYTSVQATSRNTESDVDLSQQEKSGSCCNVSESFPLSSGDTATIGFIEKLNNYVKDPNVFLQFLNTINTQELYSHLEDIDPETAARLHPNNHRKIVRAIQVYYESGRTLSSLLEEQHGGMEDVKSGPLRYPNPCILWVKCRQPDLNERLDSRVDDMMARGLVTELENFHREVTRLELQQHKESSDITGHVYPHGVLQMIGFKEFHDYLQLSPEERNTEEGKKLLLKGISDLKQATRRYARQQVRWITNRFCNRPGPNVPPIYSVDSTDLTKWDNIVEEAIQVVRAFISGEMPTKAKERISPKVDAQLVRNTCDVCGGRVFLHTHEWTEHLKSKKHKFSVKLATERRNLFQILSAREQQLKQVTEEHRSTEAVVQGSDTSQT